MRRADRNRIDVKRLATLAMLSAAALIIHVIELGFPNLSPIEGVKPGLANIITVVCVYRYTTTETALVVGVRVILGSFFAASFSTIIFSSAGALLCLLGMIPMSRLFPKLPIWVCSMIGAVLHNIGQIAVAVIYLGSFAAVGYLPILLLSGCAAGLFTGLCAQFVTERLDKRKM